MPTKAHATDAGFDLYCTSKEVNWGNTAIDLPYRIGI